MVRTPSDYELFEEFAKRPAEQQMAAVWWELRRVLASFNVMAEALTDMKPIVDEMEGFMEAELKSRANRKDGQDTTLKWMVAVVAVGQLILAVVVALATQ